jgi:spermidine dehydrogenase
MSSIRVVFTPEHLLIDFFSIGAHALPDNPNADEKLGLNSQITRRDFLNSSLLGTGAALLSAACPMHALAQQKAAAAGSSADTFTGYGGVGDYADANGNTFHVVQAAHRVRDNFYKQFPQSPEDTGEIFDLIIIGGGLTGLMTAHEYRKRSAGHQHCLILENHPVFGGEARQNEFDVNGYHLIGPQGSNDFYPPQEGSNTQLDQFFTEFKLPRTYTFQSWNPALKPLRFSYDNYANMDGLEEGYVDVAYYFDQKSGVSKPTWLLNIWSNGLKEAPFSERAKKDLLRWRHDSGQTGDDDPRFLDTITYKHYLEVVKGYDPEVTKFSQPMVGLLGGVGSDAVAARVGHSLVSAYQKEPRHTLSFPGGNSTMARHLVRGLIPDSISGDFTFESVMNGRIDFAALDKPQQPTRIRLRSTVIRVEHQAHGSAKDSVAVTYECKGRLYQTHARAVVMASGGWINKRILGGMPDDIRAAYDQFFYAPALIANIALTNWRFLYKLGAPAVRWMDDGTMFGYCANIRRDMVIGSYNPPLDPEKPTLFTFYMGLYTPGHSAREQGAMGRMRLLSTTYADYERTIRRQMTDMFGNLGFDAKGDIAGIVLNRWGHARVIQPPGFYYGVDGNPSPREVVAKGYGRIAIGHSELNGAQNYTGAFQHARRCAEQAWALNS